MRTKRLTAAAFFSEVLFYRTCFFIADIILPLPSLMSQGIYTYCTYRSDKY
jgi:hypothetical protein